MPIKNFEQVKNRHGKGTRFFNLRFTEDSSGKEIEEKADELEKIFFSMGYNSSTHGILRKKSNIVMITRLPLVVKTIQLSLLLIGRTPKKIEQLLIDLTMENL